VSYFKPKKARKTGPRSICSLPDSTPNLSRKWGRVTQQSVPIPTVSFQGCSPDFALKRELSAGRTHRERGRHDTAGAILFFIFSVSLGGRGTGKRQTPSTT
jgi:hypothetical protein